MVDRLWLAGELAAHGPVVPREPGLEAAALERRCEHTARAWRGVAERRAAGLQGTAVVCEQEVKEVQLAGWAAPLLPPSRHATLALQTSFYFVHAKHFAEVFTGCATSIVHNYIQMHATKSRLVKSARARAGPFDGRAPRCTVSIDYVDSDIRVTRDRSGALFIYTRPSA